MDRERGKRRVSYFGRDRFGKTTEPVRGCGTGVGIVRRRTGFVICAKSGKGGGQQSLCLGSQYRHGYDVQCYAK